MEVLVGSTFGIEVSSPSAAAAAYVVANSSQENNSSPCIFLKEDEIVGGGSLIGAPDDDSSDSSSSIGAPDDSDEEEEGEEVESVVLSKTALSSLDALEESLPIKRGLSNHFTGKSKSFANLSDVLMSSSSVTVKDLEKPENPFNKRRRLLMANKWCRKSSFYSWSNPKSMPLLTLNEEEEEEEHQQNQQQDEDDEDEDEDEEVSQASPSSSSSEHEPRFPKLQERKFKKSFKSHSCFSLTDLQHQEFQ